MMTSSNGNIFHVTGPLCGELTGHRWIPLTKASDAELWCFLWSAPWINGWVNNREAGDLRCHRAHYDVIVMKSAQHRDVTWALWRPKSPPTRLFARQHVEASKEISKFQYQIRKEYWLGIYHEYHTQLKTNKSTRNFTHVPTAMLSRNTPLFEPMLTRDFVTIWRHWAIVS